MAKWYFDKDGDLARLDGKTVGIFGYGNQGRSQALNMRDNGVNVIVGSRADSSAEQSVEDGFETFSIAEAAAKSDILFILVPDEIMPQVYSEHIEANLEAGNALVFASGYNIYFEKIVPQEDVDVLMVAPRMIGRGVRDTFIEGVGFPSLVAVGQDATGQAQQRMVALSKAIGSTKMGAIESSFKEETIVDLFNEQWGFVHAVRRGFEVLTEAGCSPESVILELYGSGELLEFGRYVRDIGIFHQLKLHSRTSQFGQAVVGCPAPDAEEADKDRMRALVASIRDGDFAARWTKVQENGGAELDAAFEKAWTYPLVQEEQKLYKKLGRI
ncbi:MAG: ketol-acid reductoisomerase [Rhodospirillales bacterium]|nr:ketol-acid reductoisomerase [Rhodospirillales bacterium]